MLDTVKQTPNRTHGVFAVVGGLVVIIAFFLPSTLVIANNGSSAPTPSDYSLEPMWNNIAGYFQQGSSFNYQANGYGTSEPHIFAGLLAATPLLMALIILVLGVWALFKAPSPARSALFSSAAIVITLTLWYPLFTAGAAYQGNAMSFANIPLLSLGAFVFVVGGFIIIAAAFLGWQGSKSA